MELSGYSCKRKFFKTSAGRSAGFAFPIRKGLLLRWKLKYGFSSSPHFHRRLFNVSSNDCFFCALSFKEKMFLPHYNTILDMKD